MIYDSLLLIANTIKKLSVNKIHLVASPINCDLGQMNWPIGLLFTKELKKVSYNTINKKFK